MRHDADDAGRHAVRGAVATSEGGRGFDQAGVVEAQIEVPILEVLDGLHDGRLEGGSVAFQRGEGLAERAPGADGERAIVRIGEPDRLIFGNLGERGFARQFVDEPAQVPGGLSFDEGFRDAFRLAEGLGPLRHELTAQDEGDVGFFR